MDGYTHSRYIHTFRYLCSGLCTKLLVKPRGPSPKCNYTMATCLMVLQEIADCSLVVTRPVCESEDSVGLTELCCFRCCGWFELFNLYTVQTFINYRQEEKPCKYSSIETSQVSARVLSLCLSICVCLCVFFLNQMEEQ